jgi:hypothetical protein
VLAGSSAALAKSKRADQRATAPIWQSDARGAYARAPGLPWNGIVGDTVIRDGRVIGRDPDANVRLQIYRDRARDY